MTKVMLRQALVCSEFVNVAGELLIELVIDRSDAVSWTVEGGYGLQLSYSSFNSGTIPYCSQSCAMTDPWKLSTSKVELFLNEQL